MELPRGWARRVNQPTTRVPVIDGWIRHTIEYDPGALGAVNVALLPPSMVPVSNASAVNVWPTPSRFVTVTVAPAQPAPGGEGEVPDLSERRGGRGRDGGGCARHRGAVGAWWLHLPRNRARHRGHNRGCRGSRGGGRLEHQRAHRDAGGTDAHESGCGEGEFHGRGYGREFTLVRAKRRESRRS